MEIKFSNNNSILLPYLIITAMVIIIVLCISNVIYNIIKIFINNDIELFIVYFLINIVNLLFLEDIIKRFLFINNNNDDIFIMNVTKIFFKFSKIHKILVFTLFFIIISLGILHRLNIIEIEIIFLNNIIISGIITEILIIPIYAFILKRLI